MVDSVPVLSVRVPNVRRLFLACFFFFFFFVSFSFSVSTCTLSPTPDWQVASQACLAPLLANTETAQHTSEGNNWIGFAFRTFSVPRPDERPFPISASVLLVFSCRCHRDALPPTPPGWLSTYPKQATNAIIGSRRYYSPSLSNGKLIHKHERIESSRTMLSGLKPNHPGATGNAGGTNHAMRTRWIAERATTIWTAS